MTGSYQIKHLLNLYLIYRYINLGLAAWFIIWECGTEFNKAFKMLLLTQECDSTLID